MTEKVFDALDLDPLWDRPPEFLPVRPQSGLHHWSYEAVRRELDQVAETVDADVADRRVALLAAPDLDHSMTTDGLNAGIQFLLPGERAADHRHTPAALRIGIEGHGLTTVVNNVDHRLDRLDVVLNPSGMWHGHVERDGQVAAWLDIVDLPLVTALGAVLFEPARDGTPDPVLDPPVVPGVVRYPWPEMSAVLSQRSAVDGVRTLSYGDGEVTPTLGVTVHQAEDGATVRLPAHTGGAVVLVADGAFEADGRRLDTNDVVAVRAWTPVDLTAADRGGGTLLVVDTGPALRRLGLYRQETP